LSNRAGTSKRSVAAAFLYNFGLPISPPREWISIFDVLAGLSSR